GYPGEGAAWLEEALRQATDVSSALRARGLATAGYLRWVLSEHGRSRSLASDALALFRELGDEVQVAFCLNLLGNVAMMQARFAEAQTRFAQSVALSEQVGPPAQAATTRGNLGLVGAWRGDHARGAELLEAGIASLEELGEEWAAAYFRCCLALLYRELGELDRAESMAREGLRAARAVGYLQATCFGLIAVGEVAAARGELDLAADQLEAAARETRRWGSVAAVKMAQCRLGATCVALGNHERAREVLDDALRSSARAAPNFLPGALEAVAWLVAERGAPARAAALWGGADRLRETLRIPAWPFERTRSTMLQREFRRRLGDARWVSNWQAGQGLTEPNLIAAARAALADLWPHGAADGENPAPSEPVREIAQTDGGIRYVGNSFTGSE
ncbi:MAG TPA: tetratricopeptide repeat protein, partial [Thermomicrobiaceae bacterium]|nr:tetratricopeptide repeat protein [Thermomicrobiaceae bacterium]